jgi:hypothetical protein
MKSSFFKFKYLAGLFLIIGLYSCEGPTGPAGADGADGIDGVNGTDGADGMDGNANVTIVSLLSADIVWESGSYLGRTSNIYSFTETGVNQDIIDHGTVLGFCFLSPTWWPLPFIWENNGGTSTQYVFHGYELNTISLYAYQTSGVLNPSLITEYRFLLITDNTVTKSASADLSIREKLTDAGVDVNNYYEVMQYFGLNP